MAGSNRKSQDPDESNRRGRERRPFPASSFEEALELARAIQRFSSGRPIHRLTLFDQLGKSPESGHSRQLLINSAKYGLTSGRQGAEQIGLTPDGMMASSEEISPRERIRAQAKLGIMDIPAFRGLYERFVGNKLPVKQVLIDAAKEQGLSKELAEEAVDTFVVNLQFIGLLKVLSGAERIVSIEHLLDSLGSTIDGSTTREITKSTDSSHKPSLAVEAGGFDAICFYITPIGEEGSEHRRHSDLFLGSLVEPALESFGLQVVRADKIDKPGMITKQIVDHLVRSRLVIADLSYHNPNVFYELAIRHAMRLPTVQIIRKQDRIPFDVGQARTIQIDCTDIFSLVPKIETYRAEIASQVRRALEDAEATDNPVTTFYPNLRGYPVSGFGRKMLRNRRFRTS